MTYSHNLFIKVNFLVPEARRETDLCFFCRHPAARAAKAGREKEKNSPKKLLHVE